MAVARMALSAADGTTVLTVATVESGPVTVVSVAGELDMDTAGRFTRHVDLIVSVHGPELMIVDLGQVEFLGAAGITALLTGIDSVRRGGGLLRLRRLSRPARLALESSHTLDLFDTEDDVAQTR